MSTAFRGRQSCQTNLKHPLTPTNHDRDVLGMTYVYPVVSRRAGGVSVGINLNPNNACNWGCVYCQVPGLVRGSSPEIDLVLLEHELRSLLNQIQHGDFMQKNVPESARRLNDIALSGNGEPTSVKNFTGIIALIARVMQETGLAGTIKLVLITNGSLVDRPHVQRGLQAMAELNGEVWFKLDSATSAGMRRINQTRTTPDRHAARLALAASLCPTWIQTCLFKMDGDVPSPEEQSAYLAQLRDLLSRSVPIKGVLLYGLARPSLQPQANRLAALPLAWLERFADTIRAMGIEVRVSP